MLFWYLKFNHRHDNFSIAYTKYPGPYIHGNMISEREKVEESPSNLQTNQLKEKANEIKLLIGLGVDYCPIYESPEYFSCVHNLAIFVQLRASKYIHTYL